MYVLGPKQMYIYQRPKTFFIDHRQCCRGYEARWLIAYSTDSCDLDLLIVPRQIPVKNMKEHSREIC